MKLSIIEILRIGIGITLLYIAIYMIYLGKKNKILPPILTGIGFLLIIIGFFIEKYGF